MLYSMFLTQAQERPNAPAIVQGARSITYGELNTLIVRTAKNLQALGIARGSSVAVRMENGIEYVALYYAIARLGAKIVPLDGALDRDELEHQGQRRPAPDTADANERMNGDTPGCVPTYAVASQRMGDGMILANGGAVGSLGELFNSDDQHDVDLPARVWTDDDFVIHYAADAAGSVSGFAQTQQSHTRRIRNWIETAGLTAGDRTLCILPLTGPYGADVLALPALSTGQVLFLQDMENPALDRVPSLLEQRRITIFAAPSWYYRKLLEIPGDRKADLSSLRIALCRTPSLRPEIVSEFDRRYGARIVSCRVFGQTGLVFSALERDDDATALGRPVRGVEVDIRDGALVGPDSGELYVRSDTFARRYPPDRVEFERDPWIATGELVRRDASGTLRALPQPTPAAHESQGPHPALSTEDWKTAPPVANVMRSVAIEESASHSTAPSHRAFANVPPRA